MSLYHYIVSQYRFDTKDKKPGTRYRASPYDEPTMVVMLGLLSSIAPLKQHSNIVNSTQQIVNYKKIVSKTD